MEKTDQENFINAVLKKEKDLAKKYLELILKKKCIKKINSTLNK